MSLLPNYKEGGSFLFHRAYQLVATPAGRPTSIIWGTIGKNQAPLRVQFSVERDLTNHANKAKISVTNLSTSHRQLITKDTSFALSAGYTGNTGLIFYGKADKIDSGRDGPDIITSIEAKDASDILRYATIERSYKGPTKLATIISDIVAAMQVSIGGVTTQLLPGVATSIPNKTLTRVHLTGTCSDNLKRLLDPTNLEWNVQNGRINIAPKEGAIVLRAEVLSERTGLINIPAANADFVAFQCLMNPRIFPGCLVDLRSINQGLSGVYKVRKTKHSGDTHGNEWTIDCEAIPYNAPNTPPPQTTSGNYSEAQE